MSESIWVGMRLRPLVEREKGQAHCLRIEAKQVYVVEAALDPKQQLDVPKKVFAFDVAMDSTDPSSPDHVSQEKCYEMMGERMVQHMLQGFNTCLFCYGQTGTGKTTTIMGNAKPARERGLLMRLVDDVFTEVEAQHAEGCQVHVGLQMLEVYNEKLKDLLEDLEDPVPNTVKKQIKIHVHPVLGVYVAHAHQAQVTTADDCIKTIGYGNTMKVVHATAMNAQSSRGHTICKLTMRKEGGKDNVTSNSEVYFADLAGRENEKETKVTGDRFVELGFINKSLHHLANCIRELGGPKRRKTVAEPPGKGAKAQPNDMSKFRNSKLTLLLSNALSGNSRTSMIGTLSPAVSNFEESHNTLKFASTVKTIKTQAKAAQALDKDALLKQLKSEIAELRKQLEQAREKHDDEAEKEIADHLEASHAIVAAQTRDWVHFQEGELLSKRAKSFMLSSDVGETELPYLANYSEDPHYAFKLVMHVPPDGQERSLGSDVQCDFRLPPGLGVLAVTGYIRNEAGRLLLRCAPGRPSAIEVNGTKLISEQEIQHLDLLLFGKNATFFMFVERTARASMQELQRKLASATEKKDWVQVILGEDRKDEEAVRLARHYYSQLQSHNGDSEGLLKLGAFMLQASRAKSKVDEANLLTREVRPRSGLHFELAAQAPMLSYGFPSANLPELCVRLVRRASPLERFRHAVRRILSQRGKDRVKVAFQSVLPSRSSSVEEFKDELLSTWTWSKFMTRLDMMHELRQDWHADPDMGEMQLDKLDKWKDPWAECGLADVEALQETEEATRLRMSREHQHHMEELQQRHAAELREAAQKQQSLQEELKAAKAELQRREKPLEVLEARLPLGEDPNLARCLELGKANKALLESLCGEQRNSLDL